MIRPSRNSTLKLPPQRPRTSSAPLSPPKVRPPLPRARYHLPGFNGSPAATDLPPSTNSHDDKLRNHSSNTPQNPRAHFVYLPPRPLPRPKPTPAASIHDHRSPNATLRNQKRRKILAKPGRRARPVNTGATT